MRIQVGPTITIKVYRGVFVDTTENRGTIPKTIVSSISLA